ncbi:MAG TPA: hypothetical protein VFO40_02000, partial [Chthoniobacterales bacterium]|nr:hypothetical protein [Chthoniobacterales bacterium]
PAEYDILKAKEEEEKKKKEGDKQTKEGAKDQPSPTPETTPKVIRVPISRSKNRSRKAHCSKRGLGSSQG